MMSQETETVRRAIPERRGARSINATRATVSTFGTVAGLAGLEHGIGEVLQGNVAPDGMMILSWRGSEAFRVLAGEPAMTVVPNLLVTGILAILVSLILIVWATMFVQRKSGGAVLILLSIAMLLVGGGFGPPIVGIIVGAAGARIGVPSTWWRARLSAGSRRFLGRLWPWSFAASLAAWVSLFPGSILVDRFVGVDDLSLGVAVLALSAFGFLLAAVLTGFAHDSVNVPPMQRAA